MPEPTLTKSVTPDAPVYFIADAHLGAESEARETRKSGDLLELLRMLQDSASHVYLVGDIFDFWFEYPYATAIPHPRVIASLAALSRSGVQVHFIGGNHDYWAGRKLAALTAATVSRRPVQADHFGRRLFVAHGDGLPQGDWGYRALKAVIRSAPAIAAFSLIPPRVGAAIARWASALSEVTPERVEAATTPMLGFLRDTLRSGFDAAVVGHVHRQLVVDWEEGTGVIVGDWMSARSVIELGPEGFRPLTWSDGELRDARPADPT